jgi:uncharacterized protein (TIGR02757 family)
MESVKKLKEFLDAKVDLYNREGFIENDPVCIPHSFSLLQDREIAGFFAAIFAWGNRTTIIKKSRELMRMMDDSPYQFVRGHQPKDLKPLEVFKHRTFNATDLLYFIEFFSQYYSTHDSLEEAFLTGYDPSQRAPMQESLNGFYRQFFSLEYVPDRTRKHIATPEKKSTCKRINMFLRWMVRKDNRGVDFGVWERISPGDLVMPMDLHVARVAKRFNLTNRPNVDWQSALDVTEAMKRFDPADPVKYDFALFSLGVTEKY